ncbi:hypothetical protein DRO69_13780, partial [Candidatus Bathyarchaeota archaeon]
MLRKTASGIMLTLLFISILTLAFNIQPVKAWTGTVYIRADGSIDPPDAPIITYDNVTYTLTDNITSSADGIVVERNNIVIDGAGYTLQGSGTWSKGIYLLGRSNVTIKNTNIKDFRYGVQFNSTFHSILSANNITRNVEGVRLDFSSGNALSGNSIERNEHFGVYLWESSHNTISGNYIADTYGYTDSKGLVLKKSSNNVVDGNIVIGNDYGGIVLLGSSNNIISANNVTDNGDWTDDYGIELTYCSIWEGCWPTSYSDNNTIIGNNVTRNTSGIGLCASWYNNITANTVINNSGNGIHMETSSYNTLRDNNIAGNKYNFGVFTLLDSGVFSLSTYIQDIDTTNMVNGKPVYYLVNQKGSIIDSSDIGYLALVNCTDITVRNLSLTNNGQGLLLSFTTNSTVENVTIAHNRVGIHVLNSDVNNITASNVTKNVCGINIYRASFNNITRTSLTQNSGWGGILIGRLVAGLALCATSKTVTSEYNIISNNTISDNRGYLGSIVLSNPGTKHTIIANNNITNNGYDGILLEWYSNTNTIAGNDVSNNAYGIMLDRSSNNTLRSNSMANTHYNFGVQGGSISDFVNDVDVSNTVDGKPIYYWINRMDRAIPADAGYVALVNSYNITAKGLKLKNNGQGILLVNTTNSQIINNNITNNRDGIGLLNSFYNTLSNNNITNNYSGIWLVSSSNNTISSNSIIDNDYCGTGLTDSSNNNTLTYNSIINTRFGIGVLDSSHNIFFSNKIAHNEYGIDLVRSSNNTIYHNNFLDNTAQIYIEYGGYPNVWDNGYPSGGNYWSDYTSVDADGDGIGDTPYIIDTNNQDRYPLMNPWGSGTPVASFAWSSTIPEVGELVTFDASA